MKVFTNRFSHAYWYVVKSTTLFEETNDGQYEYN